MKKSLEIRVYGIDGVTETFFQDDPDLVNRTLAELHPDSLFTRDRIAVADDFLQKTYMPPLIARIDLITDQLSVWDFPFLLGALDELTESEFVEQVRISREEKHKDLQKETTLYLDFDLLNGQRLFLGMQIVAGLPATILSKVHSLLKERRLIFGLRTAGVGILNVANVVRFSTHPEITEQQEQYLRDSDHHFSSVQIRQL